MLSQMTRDLIGAMPLPVMLIDRNERIEAANAAMMLLLGEDAEGRALVTKLRQPAIGAAVDAALRGDVPDPVTVTITGQTREITAIVHVTPTSPHLAASGGAMVSIEDITAKVAADEMRRDFVANVSHELRTPLTALIGFIETLRASAKDDPVARERFLSIMGREANRMNRLVADLLSLSRVEVNERRRPSGSVDAARMIAGVFQALSSVAEANNVELRKTCSADPATVQGELDELTQVFTNLVENAIKYGGSGGLVEVDISGVAHEPALRGPAIRIAVRDHGEGIDPIHIPRLTERFYRIDTHRSREQGGTGLGLAIVKHIINRHRGRLKIESGIGKGSCFTVSLPAATR
ncbi:ATP-binding protein [Thioclava sp. A2]|uniref:sensor histidine kinase n=1 Tax=Thioclava sp. FCG-A2 TaxID=3080562 RepID=UPI0029553F01|nr:ATP-binding protein [Thioclava sp. A2]MDV7269749.1 ATP-binding protein [Thioclava sp. A2]